MRAAVVTEEHGLEVVDVADPEPGPGELVLRVTHCGICGSDLKAIERVAAGTVMGHEFCGEIAAVGRDARDRWKEGQLVTGMPVLACGRCERCLAGAVAHCSSADLIGVAGSAGAYAELVRVDAGLVFPLNETIRDAGWGALVEPLAVGLHAVTRAAIAPGQRVLVMGGGPVGLAVLTWARRVGAGEIVVWEPVEARRVQAASLDASLAIAPDEADDPGGYDVVFECVGRPGSIAASIDAARTGGRVIVVGACTAPDTIVPVVALSKELRLDFVVYYTRQEFAHVADAISSGRLDPSALVTDRIGLDGLDAAFRSLRDAKHEIKILVTP